MNGRPYDVLRDAIATLGGTWTTDRAMGLFAAAGLQVDRNTAWGLVRHFTLIDPPEPAAGQLPLWDDTVLPAPA